MADLARWVVKAALLPYGAVARERRPGLTILNYHRVGGGTASQIDLPVELFEWQMDYVRRHCRVVPLDEVLDAPSPAGDAVAITFDDGYADLSEHAYPILWRFRLPATVYLATRFLEEGVLRPAGDGGRGGEEARPLSWAQAGELARSGLITVGGHTHAHPDLARADAAEVEADLDLADRLMVERLGVRPRHFAYPWGRSSPTSQAAVARRYRTAAVAGVQKNPYDALDLMALRRVPIQRSDGRLFFRLKLGSYLVGEEWLRRRADERNARRSASAAVWAAGGGR
ncbi:MAG: polysaccharide deacetylase family protein [bacterium]